MSAERLSILQVNTFDSLGGAARTARSLFEHYRARGHDSWLAVGKRALDDPNIVALPDSSDGAVGRLLRSVRTAVDYQLGIEDFNYPGSWQLLRLVPRRPDILHLHNLHGGYFDLRALARFSRQLPVALTLHDAWLLTGHCAHPLDSERWKIGCGSCPHLDLDPPVRRDNTAFNWRRKQRIYRASRLHLATPSRWLMSMVEQSMLAEAIVDARVIPNGVDLSVFHPADRQAARAALGLPADTRIVLFVGMALRDNPWKDYATVQRAIKLVATEMPLEKVVFIALGHEGDEDVDAGLMGGVQVRFVPYQHDELIVANYYQAADVYVHAARADTYPYAIMEALACGTPVVATAVGGIAEQVEDGNTGVLVAPGEPAALAASVVRLLADGPLRRSMGSRAALVAGQRFDLERQVDEYLRWYQEVVARSAGVAAGRTAGGPKKYRSMP